jgi:iron complex outermembrane receptor protein
MKNVLKTTAIKSVYNKKIYVMLLIFIASSALYGHSLYLYDLWSGEPVEGALVCSAKDTMISNYNGFVNLKEISGEVVIKADEYFDEIVHVNSLEKSLVYLQPYDYCETINIVRPAEVDSRLSMPTHISHINLDNQLNTQPLGMLLEAQSGVVMKSLGGYGQMQTISIRGMAASQTQTLLDGIPINNSQLGNMDFSTVSLNSLSSIDIYRGGNYMFGGNGAIGGVINLQTPSIGKKLTYEIFYQNASWDNNLIYGKVDLPLGKVRQSFFFEQAQGLNNYTIQDNGREVLLQNRDYFQRYLQYKGEFSLFNNDNIEWFFSSINKDAGAPSSYINENSEQANLARMDNESNLGRIKYKHYMSNGAWSLQGFIRNSWMEYENPSLVIDGNPLHSTHFNSEKGGQLRWNRLLGKVLLVNAGFDGSQQSINSSDAGQHNRNHMALFTVVDWLAAQHFWYFNAIHINGSARFENYSDFGDIFLPGVSISSRIAGLMIFLSAGKNYRAPTFNDLYWQPGGNINLKAENSNNFEFGINYEHIIKSFIISANSSVYRNDVSQQIKWLPAVGETYWQPQNIASVISRGVELQIDAQDISRTHKVSLNYTYGNAIKNRAEFPGDNTEGNYLPYIPKEQWNINLRSGFSKFNCGLNMAWNSFRYTSMANIEFLPSYYLLDFYAAVHFMVLKQNVNLSFAVNNVLDAHYEVIKGYPMPTRNYQFSIKISGLK